MPARAPASLSREVLGWREWVALPALGIDRLKAKIDSGAKTSSLDAFDIEYFSRDGRAWVRFRVRPRQRRAQPVVTAEAPLVDERRVRASSGHEAPRAVIRTEVKILGRRYPIELTLATRQEMGFRMLLGREALRGRFLIDPGGSYAAGKYAQVRLRESPR